MAGSYKHVTTNSGNLIDFRSFTQMIENPVDAYEAIEELYGVVWYLANSISDDRPVFAKDAVEGARRSYKEGLKISKIENRKN